MSGTIGTRSQRRSPIQTSFAAASGWQRLRLFSKWYHDLRDGRHVVVVVVSEGGATARHWIITAYIARSLGEGEVEWQRS